MALTTGACIEGTAQELPHAPLAGIGWLVLALAQAVFFIWYVRRPVRK